MGEAFLGRFINPVTWDTITGKPTGILTQTTADARYLKLSGGTLTGRVSTSLAPTATTHLTNKSYVDDAIKAILSIGTTAPTASGVIFWIDTNSSTGGLKYKNSSGSWVHVPVAYAD